MTLIKIEPISTTNMMILDGECPIAGEIVYLKQHEHYARVVSVVGNTFSIDPPLLVRRTNMEKDKWMTTWRINLKRYKIRMKSWGDKARNRLRRWRERKND